jgi:hypothetical protein
VIVRRPSRGLVRALVSLACLTLATVATLASVSCGGGGSPSSGSTPPVTPSPSPSPTAPSGGGNPGAAACRLGEGSHQAECAKTSPKLQQGLFDAMDLLVTQKPEIFDKEDEAGSGTKQYRVLDKEAYLNGLVANLIAAGYCSERDPDDANYERILVKNENGFSENFDVLAGSGPHMRRGGSYFETCTPANFPVSRGNLPPAGSGCGYPYPPPVAQMNCKLHLYGPEYYTLDSTALVGDLEYCASVGFPDRAPCPVRPEDSPERIPCEAWRLGNAQDTGRPGPTWTINGQYCTGPESGCANHSTNQFALLVYKSGTYRVCSNSGKCCEVVVER